MKNSQLFIFFCRWKKYCRDAKSSMMTLCSRKADKPRHIIELCVLLDAHFNLNKKKFEPNFLHNSLETVELPRNYISHCFNYISSLGSFKEFTSPRQPRFSP